MFVIYAQKRAPSTGILRRRKKHVHFIVRDFQSWLMMSGHPSTPNFSWENIILDVVLLFFTLPFCMA